MKQKNTRQYNIKQWIKQIFLITVISGLCCGCGKQEAVFVSLEEETTTQISEEQEYTQETETETDKMESETVEESATLIVYVCGAVTNPGVYELSQDSRLYEAIQLAGGLQKEASPESINQARLLVDGEQIYIPTKAEIAEGKELVLKDTVSGTNSQDSTMTDAANNGMINLNTASLAELTSLSGIGDNKAKAIISYREEHGMFTKPEDIMNVDGIGEGVYKKIKEFISVQ